MIELLHNQPRFLFLTGKGGVGKTSIACAAAVDLARRGNRVLLVSTDPASNVGQVFGQRVGYAITPLSGVDGLDALEIDPEAAAEEYRQRALAPIRDFLSVKDLADVTEQLSGSCTTEIASFNEFTAFLAGNDIARGYDHIVFDTAPTGHTVRLLKLPGEWTSFLEDGLGDASCLGPMAGLDKTRTTYADALTALADPSVTRLGLVARPQSSSLAEASRTADELAEAGVHATHLVINGILPSEPISDVLADAIRAEETAAIAAMPVNLAGLAIDRLPLRSRDVMGLDALTTLLSEAPDHTPALAAPRANAPAGSSDSLAATIEQLAAQDHGLIMVVGKGGVGKTTMAAAIAVGLSDRGKDVLLTTTDPAAHLAWTVGEAAPFEVSSIDPVQAVADYRRHVMDTKGAGLDADGRANLAEDLRSPCTEEVAVFQAFAAAVEQSAHRFVVMDTAPTGHTLLLMDATGSYHREVVRNLPEQAGLTPLARLQDPDNTSVIVVTLPETTPVLEATGLAADLTRANITTWGWIVNRSLTPTDTTSPLLAERINAEQTPLREAQAQTGRVAVVPYSDTPPVGVNQLRQLSTASDRDAGHAVREQVRLRYAQAATAVRAGAHNTDLLADSTCCSPASCCGNPSADIGGFGAGLYDATEAAELPLEAIEASLGCGNPTTVAELCEGERVLDLGCGGGIDVLLSARRVGQSGFAYGVDMTDEMLALARTNAANAGATNVEFLKGTIEDVPLPDGAVDVVISNCVINLSTDKPTALAEMFRVLAPGGRIGISDVVAEDHLTPAERAERGSYVGCIAGALSKSEYLQGLAAAGFTDPTVEFTHQVADDMHSAIIRATKLVR